MRIVKLTWMLVIVFAVAVALWIAPAVAQRHKAVAEGNWIEGVSDGRNLVVDMTYPVSEKFPAWPGDDHVFEAKANATVEKDGYFTRRFWMLEHYGMRRRIFLREKSLLTRFRNSISSGRRW
jgi:hypothetical protein